MMKFKMKDTKTLKGDYMNEFRCIKCDKLLGKIEGKAEIKCPRCKTINRME